MKDDMSELKKRALAIVDIYSDLNRITEREANILREAITTDRPQGEWIDHSSENLLWGHNECPFCHKRSNRDASYCQYCGSKMKGGAE